MGKAEQKLQLLESFVLNNVIIANDDVDENNWHEQIVPINDNYKFEWKWNANPSNIIINGLCPSILYFCICMLYITSVWQIDIHSKYWSLSQKTRRKLSDAVHDCRGEIFRDSSKELFNDKIYNAEQIAWGQT